jgi:hypothetical protein
MKPSEVVKALNNIASAVESSKKPDRNLVVNDIKRILVALDECSVEESQEQTALPQSKPGQDMVRGLLEKMNDAFESGNEAEFKKNYEALGRAAKV